MMNCKSWLILLAVLLIGTELPAQFLRVSDNQRFLVTSEGEPFFWLGDTGWEM
ncbi:MAG: DUF4038 domain-containing protein, partial [Bacteroidia bacterium]